jgi:hypothetical protein
VVATEGEVRVLGNLRKKSDKADAMFAALIRETKNATRINRTGGFDKKMESPTWL